MTYTKEELAEMLERMRKASAAFYALAVRAGCHPFLEFTGLMNEYIKICETAHEQGVDFTETSIHGSASLPVKSHHLAYLSEKLGCIYGNSAGAELIERLTKAAGISDRWVAIGEGTLEDWAKQVSALVAERDALSNALADARMAQGRTVFTVGINAPPPCVHILLHGRPLCEFTDVVPGEWPEGHTWVSIRDPEASSCAGCLAARQRAIELGSLDP